MQRARSAPTARAAAPTGRGVVVTEERRRLAAGFGLLLRQERRAAGLSQPALAAWAGVAECTVTRLERGVQRPTTTTTWALARALRLGLDERAALALDLRLRAAAGPSLRTFSTRTHRCRERPPAELLADGLPVVGADDFTAVTLSMLLDAS